jgi:phage terminase large subunit GpA-like protein
MILDIFDRVSAFERLRPTEIITVSQWAEKYRYLSPEASFLGGQLYSCDVTPYARKIMDCLSSYSGYEEVICAKSAQSGLTEVAFNLLGYTIDIDPCPILYLMPTNGTVERNSKVRVDPMIEHSARLLAKVSKKKSRDGSNTINQKRFIGGMAYFEGAESPSAIKSISVRKIILDELDEYNIDLDGQGSASALAEVRTQMWPNRLIFKLSTPTVLGTSQIWNEFLDTDQNYYYVPCPICGQFQKLVFENLVWTRENPENVEYKCAFCGELFSENHKMEIMQDGIWNPECENKISSRKIGFHINALYAPTAFFPWSKVVQAYIDAEKDPSKMKTFINTKLGLPTDESGEAPSWEMIYNRRENYSPNTVNSNVCFLTAGVDIQKDRIELEIVGWCSDKSSYSIDYRSLLGSPFLPDVWKELKKIIDETWITEDGRELQLVRVAIDSGYATSEVYDFVRKFGNKRVIATKGQDKMQIAFSTPKQIDYSKNGKKIGKLKQWNIGVSFLKTQLYEWFKIEQNHEDGSYPPCYCHFPQYDNKYFEGLTGEDWIASKHKWIKRYARNEPLDCRVYARAAASIIGLDRLKPEQLKLLGGVHERKKVIIEEKERTEPKESRKKREIESFW